jgi:hypothetical protein
MIKRIHYISGLTLAVFIMVHLANHLAVLGGAEVHIQIMEQLRKVYQHILVETLLLIAVVTQIFSGIRLYLSLRKDASRGTAEKYQIFTGLYLAFFLLIHVSAVLTGRFVLELDTNLYFGAAGLNKFPLMLFFIPYYFLSIVAVFGHIGAIHFRKTENLLQSRIIAGIGLVLAILILSAMTQLDIPDVYLKSFGY